MHSDQSPLTLQLVPFVPQEVTASKGVQPNSSVLQVRSASSKAHTILPLAFSVKLVITARVQVAVRLQLLFALQATSAPKVPLTTSQQLYLNLDTTRPQARLPQSSVPLDSTKTWLVKDLV